MSKHSNTAAGEPLATPSQKSRSALVLWLVMLVCLVPVVAAVVVYLNPHWLEGRATNYGTILDPQIPVPPPEALTLHDLENRPFDLRDKRGTWLVVTVDSGACDEACARKLFIVRQTHASLGGNIPRVQRVWLITDDAEVPPAVREAYAGTHMLRATPQQLEAFFGVPDMARYIWVIDPLGNLMMRFPENPVPHKFRKDLSKLLFASQVG